MRNVTPAEKNAIKKNGSKIPNVAEGTATLHFREKHPGGGRTEIGSYTRS